MGLEADLAAASDPSTSAEELARLSRSRSSSVRRAVAENVSAPREALARLFKAFPDLVLSNPASALFNLETMRPWAWVPPKARHAAVENQNATTIVLAVLASDADAIVRFGVATNASTPLAVLETLASDVELSVRAGVAKNANAPVDLLKALASDNQWLVRSGVAENAKAPVDLLKTLASDPDLHVSGTAKLRLARLPN